MKSAGVKSILACAASAVLMACGDTATVNATPEGELDMSANAIACDVTMAFYDATVSSADGGSSVVPGEPMSLEGMIETIDGKRSSAWAGPRIAYVSALAEEVETSARGSLCNRSDGDLQIDLTLVDTLENGTDFDAVKAADLPRFGRADFNETTKTLSLLIVQSRRQIIADSYELDNGENIQLDSFHDDAAFEKSFADYVDAVKFMDTDVTFDDVSDLNAVTSMPSDIRHFFSSREVPTRVTARPRPRSSTQFIDELKKAAYEKYSENSEIYARAAAVLVRDYLNDPNAHDMDAVALSSTI